MSEAPIIAGAGGGKSGGGGGGLSEQADTLKSRSYAQVLDLISEGEIGGLVNGLQSIYLDDTPIQNPDGSNNYSDITYVATNGTQDQGVIAGFTDVQSETVVGIEVKVSTGPVVRTITNTNVTSVKVTVNLPQLSYMDGTGNLGGSSVQFAIDVQNNGGGWVEKINDTITGKSSSGYERQYRIALPAGGPWDVRVRRITPDSTSSQLNNKTVWKTYTEVIDAKLRYPNSALVGVRVDASQFRSIPRRGYDVKLLKIRIPTNATVDANTGRLIYSGTWNGTFKVAWCSCPAWAYYDLLTTDRYGLGSYIDASQVDKWALYAISKYCNALVPNGFGGTEARFSCNIWLNSRQEAYSVITQMASIFRGMSYWSTGAVTATQDAPSDPVYLFTNSNVIDGQFQYQGSSAKARHTVALVGWNDPDDMYRQKVEYVEDTDGIARYGVIETEVVAVGCTSRGQAHRLGRWLLFSERYETEVIGFKAAADGSMVRPGDVIKVADQHRAGQRFGGRISAATSTTITVDTLGTVPAGTKTLYVVGADGTVQTRTVSSVAGNVITVTAAFATIPQAQSQWVLSLDTVQAQTFRVLTVNEGEEGTYEVTALTHYPDKYGMVENGYKLRPRVITSLSPIPATPASVTLTESLYTYQASVLSKITVSWPQVAGATSYRVEWRFANGNYVADTTTATDYDILNTTPGKYEVRVSAGQLGVPSKGYATATINALGKTAPPADVTGLVATIDPMLGISLNWNSVADIDLDQYEIRLGASWATGTIVARAKTNTYKVGNISGTSQTFWVKAIDTSGSYSTNAASVTTTLAAPSAVVPAAQVIDNNVLLKWTNSTATLAIDYYEIRRGSSWAGGSLVGRVSNATFVTLFETAAGTYTYWIAGVDLGGNVGTPASVSANVSQPPDYQLFTDFNSTLNGTKSSAFAADGAIYLPVNTTETVDQHFSARSWASPQSQITAGYPYFIQPTDGTGYYEEVLDYGSVIGASRVTITAEYATQFGAPVSTPNLQVSLDNVTWTDLGATTDAYATNFRYVKFRLTVASTGNDDLIKLTALNFRLDVKQKEDFGTVSAVSTDSGGTTVTFGLPFVAVTSITLTPLGTTARYAIYDFAGGANPTSFKVLLFNQSGTRISGSVSWAARGY